MITRNHYPIRILELEENEQGIGSWSITVDHHNIQQPFLEPPPVPVLGGPVLPEYE